MKKNVSSLKQPTERSRVQMYQYANQGVHAYPDFNLKKIQCSIVCDKFFVLTTGKIYRPNSKEFSYQQGETGLIFTGKGAGHFENSYKLYFMGEEVGNILAHPNENHMIFSEDNIKLELQNNLLYRDDWIEVFSEIMSDLGLQIQSFTQVDIAIDGLNHIIDFLNFYQKQSQNNKLIRMVGSRAPKNKKSSKVPSPKFSPHAFNHKTMRYENFRIGNPSTKMITCYNKSSELRRISSHKTYIPEFWAANGVSQEQDVWRLEMRLKSSAVKSIKNFDFTKLVEPQYLASIFKTHCNKFFEFAKVNPKDSNQRRNKDIIPLIPYGNLKGKLLEKAKREPSDGLFKAKMTISGYYENLYRKLMDNEAKEAGFQLVKYYQKRYHIQDWVQNQVPKWKEKWSTVAIQ